MSALWIGFLILLPLVLAVIVAVAMWRTLSHPVLFLVTGILAMFGIQSLVAPVALAVLPLAIGAFPQRSWRAALAAA
jgi:hypothetical protein